MGEGSPESPARRGETTVATVDEIVSRLMDDERARGQGLESKTSTLAGFTGAILALTAGGGRELLKLELGPVGDVSVRILYLVSIAALATAAALYIVGVLRPQAKLTVELDQIRELTTRPPEDVSSMELKGRMVGALVGKDGQEGALERERRLNDRKAKYIQFAGVALLIGLVTVAGQALVLGTHKLGL
jgi:hypothetical protein